MTAKQVESPDLGVSSIPEVTKAVRAYCEARDARMREGKIEVERRAIMHEAMKKAGIMEYKADGCEAWRVLGDEQVKARITDPDPE